MSNQKSIWFKEMPYGLGWIPQSWEGWLTLSVYALVVLWPLFFVHPWGYGWHYFADQPQNKAAAHQEIMKLVYITGISTVLLIAVCLVKGEKLRVQRSRKTQ